MNISLILHFIHYSLTTAKCCNYRYICSWWWVELPPETCRSSSLQKYNKLCIVASCWTVINIMPLRYKYRIV